MPDSPYLRRIAKRVLWRWRHKVSFDDSVPLPSGAREHLRSDNPRLVELREKYAMVDPGHGKSLWDGRYIKALVDLQWFRGDSAYVWQRRQLGSEARLKRYLLLREAEAGDRLGLLGRLTEDGMFGCWTEQYGDRPLVSRDLIDSVVEINFLERHVGLSQQSDLRVLDIGAGYGRLAHRMSAALSNLALYDCADAIPESTFLCDYYLRFRNVSPPARVLPLHQLEDCLDARGYHIAVNIHSFSECSFAAVDWWMRVIAQLHIPWLLVVPNHADELLTREPGDEPRDFAPLIRSAGYRLELKEPVYGTSEVRNLAGVHDQFFLFRRET